MGKFWVVREEKLNNERDGLLQRSRVQTQGFGVRHGLRTLIYIYIFYTIVSFILYSNFLDFLPCLVIGFWVFFFSNESIGLWVYVVQVGLNRSETYKPHPRDMSFGEGEYHNI